MEFLVKLIEVDDTSCTDARDNLYANCGHVGNDYWLFEGDEIGLHEGITFTVEAEEAIEGYDDITGQQIRKMVREIYNIDKCVLTD